MKNKEPKSPGLYAPMDIAPGEYDPLPTPEDPVAKTGYLKVQLDYAPKDDGDEFVAWCNKHDFDPLNGGRRAWCSSLSTYLRGAAGVAYSDGEPFLFYEEDLLDVDALIHQATNKAYGQGRVKQLEADRDSVDRLTSGSSLDAPKDYGEWVMFQLQDLLREMDDTLTELTNRKLS